MRIFQTPDTSVANISLFILRFALFLVFIPHGAQKMLGWFGGSGFQGTLLFFTQVLHIAPFFAALAILTEFFASLALLVGLLTRLAAFGLACIMLVAVLTVHLKFGFFMNWSGIHKGEGFEYFILAGAIALVLIIMGAGGWSIDAWLAKALSRRQKHGIIAANK